MVMVAPVEATCTMVSQFSILQQKYGCFSAVLAVCIWSDTRGKVLNTARGLQKDAESASCAHEGQRDDHARSARAEHKIAAFKAFLARVCNISDRSGLFRCEWVQKTAKTELVAPIY